MSDASSPDIDLDDLVQRIADADVYNLAHHTPLEHADKLSRLLGRNIWLKREDLQDVFSFKIRGAANRMAKMNADELSRGVCAASAGNHAQGIAISAAYYKTQAVIFMPVTTPAIKVEAVQAHGAEARLVGDSYDDACDAALDYAAQMGAVFIHPFDEVDVMAGQGTIAQEILADLPHPAAIYICTGGGGLTSGIGAWMKAHHPQTEIIAVEPEGAQTLKISLDAGQPTPLNTVDKFADGVAVRLIGQHTFHVCQQVVDRCLNVTNDEICAAVKDIFETTRTVVEPAGALALAGLIRDVHTGHAPEGDLVVTLSGANVNFDRIGHIVERAELGAGEEMLFAATIAEKPGSFLKFCQTIGHRAVTEFNYRYSGTHNAHVLVGVKLNTPHAREHVIADMQTANIQITDLSYDRLAKRHLRHMVGGRASSDIPEAIYSFEFPERPGALESFLTTLDARWNISLFHYRNHGNSTGHVLCGFHIPHQDIQDLETSLIRAGFPYEAETQTTSYQYFLKS